MDKVRGILRELLGKEIVLYPTADGVDRFLTAEITGVYAGLLRLALGKNKGGGGHPLPDLFRPTIRVPLRSNRGASEKFDATNEWLA
ncbi:MAG TPA: hypothetical protein VJT11_09205 [Nitrospiraceae bacterium]|nr:hypothetical protein [Nitrospiraceae bacterium]